MNGKLKQKLELLKFKIMLHNPDAREMTLDVLSELKNCKGITLTGDCEKFLNCNPKLDIHNLIEYIVYKIKLNLMNDSELEFTVKLADYLLVNKLASYNDLFYLLFNIIDRYKVSYQDNNRSSKYTENYYYCLNYAKELIKECLKYCDKDDELVKRYNRVYNPNYFIIKRN